MNLRQQKTLARRIAQQLFTDGDGNVAHRLQLMHRNPGTNQESAGGGWGVGGVFSVVLAEIQVATMEPSKRKGKK